MFFGLTNSPATFQAMMNELFKDLIHAGVVVVYLDDILIFANTKEELHRKTVQVMKKLQANKLYLKWEKCEFDKTSIEFLGTVIEDGTITMEPGKVEAVRNWKTPKSKKEVQRFLGFCNFYRHFIENYSGIVVPLIRLTQKGVV